MEPDVPKERSAFRGYNTEDHPPLERKLEILHRCFELGEDVQSVSSEAGDSMANIYAWRREYIQKGAAVLMNPSNERTRGKLAERKAAFLESTVMMVCRYHGTLAANHMRNW